MECSQIRVILFENADTEIPMEFREEVEAHLATCKSCAMQLEALKEQSRALGALPGVKAPGDFLERVRSGVEKPSIFSRLEHRFSHLFARKHFIRLAGAAATAVVVIAAAQVILREGAQKTLLSPAPSQVGSSRPGASPPAAAVPPNPPAEDGKAFKSAVPPSVEPRSPAGVEAQSVALTLKPHGAPVRGKTGGGSVKTESFSSSRAGGGGIRPQHGSSLKPDASKGASRSERAVEGGPPSEAQKISSDVIRLIERSNGKVLSAGPTWDENRPRTVAAEMPAANYPSFLDQLRLLGEVEFNGNEEFSPAPGSQVRVSVSFGRPAR